MSAILTKRLERLSEELTGNNAIHVQEAANTIEKLEGEIARLECHASFYAKKFLELNYKLKHLAWPRGIEQSLSKGLERWGFEPDYFNNWTLEKFLEETSPAMVLVGCKGIGRVKFRRLVRFLLDIHVVKTMIWLDQNPDVWDWQTPDIKKYREKYQ